MKIHKRIYYRMQHVTGPGCVLLSLCFGETPDSGPRIIRTLASDKSDIEVNFNLEKYVAEVRQGVEKANKEFGGQLQVEEIQIVPDDYPQKMQVEQAAYKIAKAVIQNEI
jgi:hypothetical protein